MISPELIPLLAGANYFMKYDPCRDVLSKAAMKRALLCSLDTRKEIMQPWLRQARVHAAWRDPGGEEAPSHSSGGVVAPGGPVRPYEFLWLTGLAWKALVRGRQVGCVWQSDCAPDLGLDGVRAQVRPTARHRKPPLWRRAALGVMPRLAAGAAHYRLRPGTGRVAPATRGR
jgi:hypothetical protein